MTDLARAPITRSQRSGFRQLRALGAFAPLLPLPIGLVVGLLSLMIGADPIYVLLQLLLFVLLIPLIYLLRNDEKYTPSILLVTVLKIFFVCQVISIFVWHAPDESLLNPTTTELAIAVGLASGMMGVLAAKLIYAAVPRMKPVLAWSPNPDRLHRLGLISAAIGLPSQIAWTYVITHASLAESGTATQSGGAPVFVFLSQLAILSICCFAAEQLLRTDRRTFLSRYMIVVLVIYFMAILPLATKTEPLRPLVALFAVAVLYRWKPKPVPILAGALLLVIVIEFFYPAITLARLTAYGEQKPVAEVLGEIAVKSIADPTEFEYVRDYSDKYDIGVRQNYYGRALGFWDRFTPQITDQLITGAQYLEPIGPKVFGDALYQVLPQSLGFRKTIAAQQRIETAISRADHATGKVGWTNSGFIGDGYLTGGLPMVACVCFLFGVMASLTTRLVFVTTRHDILWVPFFVFNMFAVADGGLVTGSYPYFWGWAIYLTVTFLALRYLARRDPGILAQV